jgi:hypothetical protein
MYKHCWATTGGGEWLTCDKCDEMVHYFASSLTYEQLSELEECEVPDSEAIWD